MAVINQNNFRTWRNGDVLTATDYNRERNTIIAAVNGLSDGGSGLGDVIAAGNNTFTGTNEFTQEVKVLLVPTNTWAAASKKYVDDGLVTKISSSDVTTAITTSNLGKETVFGGIYSWSGLGSFGATTITVNGGSFMHPITRTLTSFNVTTITPIWSATNICIVYVSIDGTIGQQTTPLTSTERRTKYILTTLYTENGTTVTSAFNNTYMQRDAIGLMRDLLEVTGQCKSG